MSHKLKFPVMSASPMSKETCQIDTFWAPQWRRQKIFMRGVIHWRMVVICAWCALFVTSQFDVIFMFSSEVC